MDAAALVTRVSRSRSKERSARTYAYQKTIIQKNKRSTVVDLNKESSESSESSRVVHFSFLSLRSFRLCLVTSFRFVSFTVKVVVHSNACYDLRLL